MTVGLLKNKAFIGRLNEVSNAQERYKMVELLSLV
jgi:hypothetical protein